MSARLNAGVGTNLPTPLPTPLAAALETSGVHLPIPFLDLSAQVIRDLPLENVAALQRFISDAKSELGTLAAMVQTGLEMRYADAAKAQLLAMQDGQRVARFAENGERVVMDDSEHEAEVERLSKYVARNCK